MKPIVVLAAAFLAAGFGQDAQAYFTKALDLDPTATQTLSDDPKVLEEDRLVERDRLKYEIDSGALFTGIGVRFYPNGQKEAESEYRDGVPYGRVTVWYENGQKKAEVIRRDGMEVALMNVWYENGQKKEESVLRDGDYVSRVEWDENGDVKPQPTLDR